MIFLEAYQYGRRFPPLYHGGLLCPRTKGVIRVYVTYPELIHILTQLGELIVSIITLTVFLVQTKKK